MYTAKRMMCLGSCLFLILLFSVFASAEADSKDNNGQKEGVWVNSVYTPRIITGSDLDSAIKDVSMIFGMVREVKDNIGIKLSGRLDFNDASNQANLGSYLKSVEAHIIARDTTGEFRYLLSRTSIKLLNDRIYLTPVYSLFYPDLIFRQIYIEKLKDTGIRLSWPDENWNLSTGIAGRASYKRPYVIHCGALVSLFLKNQTDTEKVADVLYSIQQNNEKNINDRRAKLESLAPQYRELTIKPPVTEEQRKNIVLAEMMTGQKDYQGAINHYLKVINLDLVSYPSAYFNLALLSAQMERYQLAIYYMKLYLLLVPDSQDARSAQDKIYEWEYMLQAR